MHIFCFLRFDNLNKNYSHPLQVEMLFNFGKYKCLHTGPGNTGMNYEMGGNSLSKTVKEKDLGVTMNANMKVSEQFRIAASKGNQVLGMIRRNITYKKKSFIIHLYKAIFRPHLEYRIQAWNPYLRKDIDMLEKIQRRATKLVPGLRDLTRSNICSSVPMFLGTYVSRTYVPRYLCSPVPKTVDTNSLK